MLMVLSWLLFADKEIVTEHTQRRDPGMKGNGNTARASPSDGVDAENSASRAFQCDEAPGRELTVGGEQAHAA